MKQSQEMKELMKQVLILGQCSMSQHQFEAFRKLVMNLFHTQGKEKDRGQRPIHDEGGGANE